jgi:hypothetical protein
MRTGHGVKLDRKEKRLYRALHMAEILLHWALNSIWKTDNIRKI